MALDAVLEAAGGRAADRAALVRISPTRDTVWAFRAAGSEWAGGAARNRRARATLRLEPGLYRASVQTGRAHAWRDWAATPPWTPAAWGLSVRGPETVSAIDVDATARDVRRGASALPVVAEMRCVGPDEAREVAFDLSEPTEALLVAQGEIATDGAYDYATLLRGSRAVWTMTRRQTEPAGGRGSNRRAAALALLAPGRYTLRYVTDDSHDCTDGYRTDDGDSPPADPALWGAALVSLDPAFDAARSVAVVTPPASPAEAPPADADLLADLARVGNDADLSAPFALREAARLRVVATGELLPGERLDYGWIEDARGRVVWEMSRANTAPAGGAPKNRRADETVTLPAGAYVARYVTNGRHAFGAFDGAPDAPEAWGIRVERLGAGKVRL